MALPPPIVKFHALHKRYGDSALVLADINLVVNRGEFVSVIGPSGCGKSTLLKLVSGLSPVTAGALSVDGRSPIEARDSLSFIFQDATLLPWLTAQQNVELPLRLRGEPAEARSARARELLELVRLGPAAGLYPRQLSGGMKMRVSLARALASQPGLLLLDEPFGALDEMTRHHLNEELLTLRARAPFTALFVTHSVEEAVFLSTRILVMGSNPGRILADVPVDFAHPRDAAFRETAVFHGKIAQVAGLLRGAERSAAA